jgi:hypothetical protein
MWEYTEDGTLDPEVNDEKKDVKKEGLFGGLLKGEDVPVESEKEKERKQREKDEHVHVFLFLLSAETGKSEGCREWTEGNEAKKDVKK